MVGVALLRAFDKLFYLQFCDSSDRLKNIVQERFYQQFERYFYIKIIGTIIPTYLVRNFSPLFVLSYNNKKKKKKKRIKLSASCQFGNQVFCFLLYSESRSSSKACRIQQIFIKEFYQILFLLVLWFYVVKDIFRYSSWSSIW